ncbi:MAG: site-specific integrase [Bacteroidia bacterium]|nr:site-specific integrase [Bacteroidia bacterium]
MNWTAKLVTHHAKPRIAVYFEKNAEWIARIKKLEGVRWSRTLKAWHVPDTEENRIRFKLDLPVVLTEIHLQKIAQFKRWLSSKRYSANTIKTYSEALQTFLKYYHHKPIEQINNEDLIGFNNDYILKNKLSASFQNQIVNGVKLFFKQIQGATINVDLVHRPKREKLLPNVLSKEEVKEILEATHNIKHKAMLSLIYACGLRSGELLNLTPMHIDSKRGVIIIKQAKGKKDRIAPLGEKIIEMLRNYFVTFKPEKYLFEGQEKGNKYDARSLQQVLKQSLAKTSIKKPVTLHWLRHSYATHLLENGTDLRYIQEILGHKSSKTTEIYTHVSTKSIQKIKSPFDNL